MHSVEGGKDPTTPCAQSNYTAFLVAHARILQKTGKPRGWNPFRSAGAMHGDSRKYLEWALAMSPENASVWLCLGAAWDDRKKQLECYQKALHYCFLKDGPYGLTEIYRHLAEYYLQAHQMEAAAALRDFILVLGGDPGTLSSRVSSGKRHYKDVMGEHGIQIGFSRLALFAVMLLQTGEDKDNITPEVSQIMDTILSSPVQKSPLF